MLNSRGQDNESLIKVLKALALCHTVILDTKKGCFTSSSPDELALVNAAKQFGIEFKGTDSEDNMELYNKMTRQTENYKLMNICEFTSTRKRQSNIFKVGNEYLLICKGADSVIEERLNTRDKNNMQMLSKTREIVNNYATEGLRTLYLA